MNTNKNKGSFNTSMIRSSPDDDHDDDLKIGPPPPSESAKKEAEQFLSSSSKSSSSNNNDKQTTTVQELVNLRPEVMAAVLLKYIPHEDSVNRTRTNKVLQAFEYVKSGIQHRAKSHGIYLNLVSTTTTTTAATTTTTTTTTSAATATKTTTTICVPDGIFYRILCFLDKRDLIDNISHVSNSWAKASLNPCLHHWQKICTPYVKVSPSNNGRCYPGVRTEEALLTMLNRPQFAHLKVLINEHVDITEDIIIQIAELFPQLEELSGAFGYTCRSGNALRRIPTLFPKMNSVSFQLSVTTHEDMIHYIKTMGERLVSLNLEVAAFRMEAPAGLTDDDFALIGQCCPNLKRFRYTSSRSNPWVHSIVETRGIIALIDGCPKLEYLWFDNTCRKFKLADFKYIASNAKNLRQFSFGSTWSSTSRDREHARLIRTYFLCRLEDKDDRNELFLKLLPLATATTDITNAANAYVITHVATPLGYGRSIVF